MRLVGPDGGVRAVFLPSGAPARGRVGTVYADAAGTVLADILAHDGTDTPGAPIAGSTLTVDSFGLLPLFWFPENADRVWVTVNDGPLTPVDADNNARIDVLAEVLEELAEDVTAQLDELDDSLGVESLTRVADTATLADVARAFAARLPRPRGLAVGARGSTVDLYEEVTPGGWWRTSLTPLSVLGGNAVHMIRDQAFCVPAAMVGAAAGGVVTAGAWTTGANGSSYGGNWYHSSTSGHAKTWTSPDGTTALTLAVFMTSNGGLARVLIDGDASLATGLPTAQQLVDAGLYASTILVGGGGTLAPTDRVLSTYSLAAQAWVDRVIAVGLAPGVHTVRYEATGYTAIGGGGARAYISGFGSHAGEQLGAGGTHTAAQAISTATSAASVTEFALRFAAVGDTSSTIVGNAHGYETQLSLAVHLDGVAGAPADGSITVLADSARIVRASTLTTPEQTPDPVADIEVVYTLTRAGLSVDTQVTWLLDGTVTTDYVMLPLPGAGEVNSWQRFDRADLSGNAGGPLTLTGPGADTSLGTSASPGAVVWQAAGHLAAAVWLDNPSEYLRGLPASYVQDRAGGTLAKAYLVRADGNNTEPVGAGESRRSAARYAHAYLADPQRTLTAAELDGPPGPTGPDGPPGAVGPTGLHGVAGRFYPLVVGTPVAVALAQNIMRVVPFFVPPAQMISELHLSVTIVGQAGSTLRFVAYDDTGDYWPGALVYDSDVIAADTLGQKSAVGIAVLAGGVAGAWYWLTAIAQSAPATPPTVRYHAAGEAGARMGGLSFGEADAATPLSLVATGVTGAPPATFPAAAGSSAAAPRVVVRLAAN
jgi:hypothetical protein